MKDEQTGTVYGPGLDLYPGQAEYFLNYLSFWLIVGKARQVGASWLAALAELWVMLFRSNVAQAIIAQDDSMSVFHLERVRWLYWQQPAYLRRAVPIVGRDNKHQFGLTNGSRIMAYPCTGRQARGLAAWHVRLEEFALWDPAVAKAVLAAVMGTVGVNGLLSIVSTANGEGNPYHKLWRDAERGENKFHTVFFPWWTRPDMTPERRAEQDNIYGADLAKQEFPGSPAEMFIASGTKYFDLSRLFLYEAGTGDVIPFDDFSEPVTLNDALEGWPEGWTIFEAPVPGRAYAMGADPSDGGGDGCCADIVDVQTGRQVAQIYSTRWGWDRFTEEAVTAARTYNNAFIVWERNNHGHACIAHCTMVLGYHNLYRQEHYDPVKQAKITELGWDNNSATRPVLLGRFKTALSSQQYKLASALSLGEVRSFEYNSSMRIEAKKGAHDDTVFGGALANLGRETILLHGGDQQAADVYLNGEVL